MFGPVDTNVVDLTQPMRNAGGSCLLVLPTVIGVTSAIQPPGPINVTVSPPASIEVRAGMTLTLGLVAKWPVAFFTAPTSPPAGSRCNDPINQVIGVAIPLASGAINLDLNPVWLQVCPSPASVGLGMTTT